jgi:hypothetical protein
MSTELKILKEFSLLALPTVQEFVDDILCAGQRVESASCFRLAREVFYKSDSRACFEMFQGVDSALADRNNVRGKKDVQRNEFNMLTIKDLEPEAAASTVMVKYAYDHFRDWADTDSFYALPQAMVLQELADVLVPAENESMGGMIDDTLMPNDVGQAAWASKNLRLFRVVNAHPKRRKLFSSAVSELRPDHVAVQPLCIDFASATSGELTVTAEVCMADNVVQFISVVNFLEFGMESLKQRLYTGSFVATSAWHFQAQFLEPECLGVDARVMVTYLVAASAFPGSDDVFMATDSVPQDRLRILDLFVKAQLVGEVSPKSYHITEKGMMLLQRTRRTCERSRFSRGGPTQRCCNGQLGDCWTS